MSEDLDYFCDSSLNYEEKLLEKIRYAKELYDEQVEKVKKEQYILRALHQDVVDKIRERKSRYDMINTYTLAQAEVGSRYKKDRPHLETIKRWLMEDFLDNDRNFKLKAIVSCGFEDYAWRFEFEGYGKTIDICVPYMRNITTKNVQYAHYGMFTFSIKESDHVWKLLKGSYEMSEIAQTIKDYVKVWTGEVEGVLDSSLSGSGTDEETQDLLIFLRQLRDGMQNGTVAIM